MFLSTRPSSKTWSEEDQLSGWESSGDEDFGGESSSSFQEFHRDEEGNNEDFVKDEPQIHGEEAECKKNKSDIGSRVCGDYTEIGIGR